MFYFSDYIKSIDGVLNLVPVKRGSESTGHYRVLVKTDTMSTVRQKLKVSLPKWYDEHVEPDGKRANANYSGTPEVTANNADAYSSGDGT